MQATLKRPLDSDETSRKRYISSAPVSPRFRNVPVQHGHSASTRQGPEQISTVDHKATVSREILAPRFQSDASLVLVGIRGSGKRSLGFIAATALGRRFITEDHYFQTITGSSRQEYLRLHGSEEFHKQDVEISRCMLEDNKQGCVIDCGLGSLTSNLQEYLKTYSLSNPVIYILRDMEKIKLLLKLGERSAKLLEGGDPTHRRCSNYEFFNLEDDSAQPEIDSESIDRGSPGYSFKLKDAQADFSYFVRLITGHVLENSFVGSAFSLNVPIEQRSLTHALRIPISAFEDNNLDLYQFEAGGDVVEIFIDRWKHGSLKLLSHMVASVRRCLRVDIMVTGARKSAGFSTEMYMSILRQALRLGVELLSVDLELDRDRIGELMSLKGSTRIIGTYMDDPPSQGGWRTPVFMQMSDRAIACNIDLVRLLRVTTSRLDNDDLNWFEYRFRERYGKRLTLIAYNVGPFGRTSQVFNSMLTSVTHDRLQDLSTLSVMNQPNISAFQAVEALFTSFTLDPLRFYVLGANVSNSLSPAMHNDAYKALGFPHSYSAVNVKSWADIEAVAKSFDFGGSAIAQPWKVKIVSEVAHLSEHAKAIGAINTLVPVRNQNTVTAESLKEQAAQRNRAGEVKAWYGDNSDWISIHVCLSQSISPRNVIQPKSTALVVGAGGMARAATYALLKLGCRNIFIYNRTLANAKIMAQHFNTWLSQHHSMKGAQIHVLPSVEEAWPAEYAFPTILVSCVTHERLDSDEFGSDFVVPEQWLGSETGGTAVEQAYYVETPFVQHLKKWRVATGRAWVVVDGLEVLHEQGVAQFEIMTGKKAPRRVMANALHRQKTS